MAKRIRRGRLTVGAQISDVANMEWDDNYEFDRSKADEEMHGIPVKMSEGGSGSVELLAGNIAKGYQTNDWVFTYNEITNTNGVESSATKTVTFYHVTTNIGGSIPAEGRGSVKIKFEYGDSTNPA